MIQATWSLFLMSVQANAKEVSVSVQVAIS